MVHSIPPKKFVELTRFNNKKHSTENDWFRHCSNMSIPYVTMHIRGSLADVHWDYMAYNTDIDEPLFALAPKIHSQAQKIYEPYATEDSWISLGPGVISFRHLSIINARNAAEGLFDIISEATTLIGQR